MKSQWPTTVPIYIPEAVILTAKGCDPNGCAIKVVVKEAIGGHGYVFVDASGISISRRHDYREKAFLPRKLAQWMVRFDAWSRDRGPKPSPIKATLKFFRTTRIAKTRNKNDAGHAARLAKQRATRQLTGANKKYDMRRRIVGIATAIREATG